MALQTLAEEFVDGADVTITDVETAISDYAAEHPTSIKIASKSGYSELPHVAKRCPCFPASIEYASLQPDARAKIITFN